MALDIIELVKVTLGVLHTFVRFLPLGMYFFSYLSSVLFKDRRAAIILGSNLKYFFIEKPTKSFTTNPPNIIAALRSLNKTLER